MIIKHKENKESLEITITVEYPILNDESFKVIKYIENYQKNAQAFALRNEDGVVFVDRESILYATINATEIELVTIDERYRFKGRLYQLMDELGSDFIQSSKSSVLNYKMLKKLEYSFSGNMCAVFFNGDKLEVSRSFVKELKEKLGI